MPEVHGGILTAPMFPVFGFFTPATSIAIRAKALVIFPGGFGTLDELFEILTLEQTEKLADRTAILLYGSEYWDPILDIGHLAEWGAISPEDPDLLIRVNSVDEALDALKRNLELHLASEEEDQMAPAISKTNR